MPAAEDDQFSSPRRSCGSLSGLRAASRRHDRPRSDVQRRRSGGQAPDDRQFRHQLRRPSLFISVTTNTYSPYIDIGDEAYPDPSHDQVIRGTDYQEVLTNFPLASQILTGLFLEMMRRPGWTLPEPMRKRCWTGLDSLRVRMEG